MRCGRIDRGTEKSIPQAWRAERWWQRLRGLLFRPPLATDGSQAIVIIPCGSVHTFGMTYPLDVVFLDEHQRVCGWRQKVLPWRAAGCRGAKATVELHGGALERLNPELGQVWKWQAG